MLAVAGVTTRYYLAAACAPASGFRWAWLYEDMRKPSFLDSHVRLFEVAGGVWREWAVSI